MEKENKKRKKIIIIIILLLLLFITLFFVFRTRNYFPVELYDYLKANNIEDGNITKEFLEENDLFDSSFTCENIDYSNDTIEFKNCKIEDKEENYCVFEDDKLSCYKKDNESNFQLDSKVPTLNYNEDQLFRFDYSENSDLEVKVVNYCTTTEGICNPDKKYDGEEVPITTESLTNKVCFQATYTDKTSSEIICTDDIILDKSAPSIEDLIINGQSLSTGWYNSLVTIDDVIANDSLTGIKEINILEDIKNGVNRVEVTAYDNANNSSRKDFIVKVDTIKPSVGTIIVDGILGNNGWYKSEVKLTKINGDDDLSGHKKSILNVTSLKDTPGTNVILTTYDNALNFNTTSKFIKVDTKKPTINGISDLVIDRNTKIDLMKGVSASDSMSKVAGDVKIISNNLDITKTGEYTVTYQVSDNAGNVKTQSRKIIVRYNSPEVSFEVDDSLFTNGFAKTNIEVGVNIKDNNTLIKDVKYCTTTSGNCIPDKELNSNNKVLLDKESNNNKVCVKVTTDEDLIVCSDIYKIDKTAPVINDPTVSGDPGNNGWYKSFIEINHNGAIDNLSGLKDIDVDIEEINYNTAGETVTIIAIDYAGNVATKEFIYKVDTVNPVIGNYIITGTKENNDFYTTDVYVSGENASDSLSGIESINLNYDSFTNETTGTDIVVTAKDKAGNISVKRETIKIDKTAPTIIDYDITEKNNDTDWHKTEVILDNFNIIDTISGVDQSVVDNLEYIINYETPEECVEVRISDLAGNVHTEMIKVKVDLTPPTPGVVGATKEPNSNGWYNSDVNITTTEGSDSLSGVKSTDISLDVVTGQLLETTVYSTTTDNAGHTSSSSLDIKIDKILPEVGEIVPDREPDSNGWYNNDVKIGKIDGSDSGSGHGTTIIDLLEVNTNTVGTNVTIKTTDQADNEATYYITIKLDKEVPTITKNGNIEIEKGESIDLTTKFTSTFGISGGATTCTIDGASDTSLLDVGTYNVTCTATSVAGLSDSITTTFDIVDKYDPIEYIESDGDQYINTGIYNTGDYIFEDEFLITDLGLSNNDGSWIVGGRVNPNYSMGVFVNTSQVIGAYGAITKTMYPGIKKDTWYKMYFSRFKLTLNTTNYVVNGQLLIPEEYKGEIVIGGNQIAYDGVSRDTRNMKGKRKYFKITDATTGELIRHYVPVQLSDGEVGMWELVEDKFYGNDGEGSFTLPTP